MEDLSDSDYLNSVIRSLTLTAGAPSSGAPSCIVVRLIISFVYMFCDADTACVTKPPPDFSVLLAARCGSLSGDLAFGWLFQCAYRREYCIEFGFIVLGVFASVSLRVCVTTPPS